MDRNVTSHWEFLHYAVKHCFHGSLRRQISGEEGRDVNTSDHIGHTALHKAVIKGCLTCCQTLIELGADVNQRDVFGQTPLYSGSLNGISGPGTQLLLRSGANPSITNREKRLPLHECVDSNNLQAIAELLKFTATEELLKEQLSTRSDITWAPPLKYVVQNEKHEVLAVFIQHLLELGIEDDEYKHALALACEQKDVLAMEIILKLTGVHVRDAYMRHLHLSSEISIQEWVACTLGLKYSKVVMQGCCDVTQLRPFVYCKENYPMDDYRCLQRALFTSGYKFTPEDEAYILEVDGDLRNEVRGWLQQAQSLRNICRKEIRASLTTNPLHAVPTLILPQALKEFLLLSDFVIEEDN